MRNNVANNISERFASNKVYWAKYGESQERGVDLSHTYNRYFSYKLCGCAQKFIEQNIVS